MLATEQVIDLCSTCIDHPVCKSDYRRPIWFCEQYTDFIPATKKNQNVMPAKTRKSVKIVEMSDSKFKGLCINCDHRELCPLAKKEGGVWHCEEYQ